MSCSGKIVTVIPATPPPLLDPEDLTVGTASVTDRKINEWNKKRMIYDEGEN